MLLTRLPLDVPGKVYRSAMPFGYFDPTGMLLQEYKENEVQVVIALAEEDEMREETGRDLLELYRKHGFTSVHFPILDFSVPDMDSLVKAVEEAWRLVSAGRTVAIHCFAGQGRTGLFAACLARRATGMSGDEALAWFLEQVPNAAISYEQENMVRAFPVRASEDDK